MKISYSHSFSSQDLVESFLDQWEKQNSEYCLMSSGSTGTPKSITLKRSLLEWSAKHTKQEFNINKTKIFCCLPLSKTGGYMQLVRAMVHRWDIFFTQPSAEPLSELPVNHEYGMTSLSPLQISNGLKHSPEQLSRFKYVLIGGAPISAELMHHLIQFSEQYPDCQLIETYGMTETASHIAYRRVGEEWFSPLNGVSIETKDNKLRIQIAEVQLDIVTNDLIHMNGSLFKVLGRADHVINSGAIKIHPELVEFDLGVILQTMGISRRYYLSSKPDPQLGEKLILVMEGETIHDVAFILEHLKREMKPYHAPKEIQFIQNFSFTDTGKVKRIKWHE